MTENSLQAHATEVNPREVSFRVILRTSQFRQQILHIIVVTE